jgi:hypothetical protein
MTQEGMPMNASLLSVTLTAVAITVNHLFTLGAGALLLGAVLLVAAAALFTWFRRTASKRAFVGYAAVNAWIIVGFGAIQGLWSSTLPVFVGTMLSSRRLIRSRSSAHSGGRSAAFSCSSAVCSFSSTAFV